MNYSAVGLKKSKATVNNVQLHYEIRGDGFPLLMIMGWTANKDWWPESLLERLEKHYALILFDNRGSGRSESPQGSYRIQHFADGTADLLDILSIKRMIHNPRIQPTAEVFRMR